MIQDKTYLKYLAATVSDIEERELAEAPDSSIVPPGERIEAQPLKAYAPPGWLRSTASLKEYNDLAALLHELWQFNEDYTGHLTKEVEAYLSTTQQNRPLSDSLKSWCESYFSRRVAKTDPKDRGDPVRTLNRLMGEYERVVRQLHTRSNSINQAFLCECTAYVQWLLCFWLDEGMVASPAIERLELRPAGWAQPRTRLQEILRACNLFYDALGPTLACLACACPEDELQRLSAIGNEALVERLRYLSEDICQMQLFLVRNFNPRKTIVTLPGKGHLAMAWGWTIRYGMALIMVAPSIEAVEMCIRTNRMAAGLLVLPNGIMCDHCKPWITAKNECRISDVNLLAVNVYLLGLFHEKLFSFYEQIDFDRIRMRAASEESDEDASDEVLALSCHDVATHEAMLSAEEAPTPEKTPARRLRPLRSNVLLRWLETKFDCEVKPGKGSEITVYRIGGKKCIVRSHGQSEMVHVIALKKILQVLGISHQEWLGKVRS